MQMLEVALGLIAYFLLMSMVASAIIDLLENRIRKKGRVLLKAVRTACGGGHAFTEAFYKHPRIEVLYEGDTPSTGQKVEEAYTLWTFIVSFFGRKTIQNQGLPSAIPNDAFARAFLETAIGTKPEEVRDLRPLFAESTRLWQHPQEGLGNASEGSASCIPKEELDDAYRLLRPLVLEANGSPQETLSLIAAQFKNVNERATGWYKRWVSTCLFWIGCLLALATNGDALRIVGRLNTDPALRASMLNLAEAYGSNAQPANADTPPKGKTLSRAEILKNLATAEALTGSWSQDAIFLPNPEPVPPLYGPRLYLGKFAGLLLTAVAISLGAPFWFQLLQMLLKLRGGITGKAQNEQAEPPSPTRVQNAQEHIRANAETTRGAQVAAKGPELDQAIACARLSASAYLPREAFEASLPIKPGHNAAQVTFINRRTKIQLEPGTELTVDTQAYIVRDGPQLTVVFRGTEPKVPADIITDLRFKLIPATWTSAVPGAEVHRGFAAALDAVWEELSAAWKSETELPRQVLFCGHSLGGALAVLAATRFLAEDETRNEIFRGLYTIGQPRVGNAAFATWAAKLLKGRYLRAINNRDIVPRVPPAALGYAHFGSVHYFDADGKLSCDPSWFFRFLDTSIPEADLAKVSSSDTLLALKEAGTDHSSDSYAALYVALRSA